MAKWAAILTLIFATLGASGCEDGIEAETSAFEAAEIDYRQGNYADAMEGYQAFLERYPQSPLAPSAEMRLRSIHREVSSVMERTGSPRPSYHGLDGEQSTTVEPSTIEPLDDGR